MALTPSGTISMSNINSALGRSSTAAISFSDSQVRFLANQDAGSVNMNAMRNKYNFVGTITSTTYFGDTYGYIFSLGGGSITGTVFYGITPSIYSGASPYAYVESPNINTVFPNITMRLKVGSNQINSMYRGNASGTSVTNSYYQAGQIVFSSDVGVTRTWQFSQA